MNISKQLPREAWLGWGSSSVEAYNMAIYSFLAPGLASKLFQEHQEEQALLLTYSLLFVGSFFYPLGALYYGFVGDRWGRKRSCIYSTLGLGIVTGLMGILPLFLIGDSLQIGFLLLIAMQYFFSGGEYYGSIVFSLEHGGEGNEGATSGVCCLFAVAGLATASGLATLSLGTAQEFWMIASFFLGALGGIFIYFLKNHCQETPTFKKIAVKEGEPFSFFRREWRTIAGVTLLQALFSVSYSFIFLFLPLLNLEAIHDFATLKSLTLYGVLLMIAGYLADRMGNQTVIEKGCGVFILLILPLSHFCKELLTLQLLLTAIASFFIGPLHAWTLRQFRVHERCRGIFCGAAVATALCSGTTVPICLLLFDTFHSLELCALYPLSFAIASYIYLRQNFSTREPSCAFQTIS